MQEITSQQEFTAAIATGRVLVDFWAPWCSPCKVLTPILEEVASRHTEMTFVKLNADSDHGQEIAVKYGVGSLPTMILFQDGKKMKALVGNTTKGKIEGFIS